MIGKKKFRIAVVEDNPFYNKVLTGYLKNLCNNDNYPDFNFEFTTYHSVQDCDDLDPDTRLMILDYYLDSNNTDGHATGLAVMEKVNDRCKNCKVVVVSEQANMAITAELFKQGIYEYVEKDNNSANRVWGIVQKILKEEHKPGFFKRLIGRS